MRRSTSTGLQCAASAAVEASAPLSVPFGLRLRSQVCPLSARRKISVLGSASRAAGRRADVRVHVHEAREDHRASQICAHARGLWPACGVYGFDAPASHSNVNETEAVGVSRHVSEHVRTAQASEQPMTSGACVRGPGVAVRANLSAPEQHCWDSRIAQRVLVSRRDQRLHEEWRRASE